MTKSITINALKFAYPSHEDVIDIDHLAISSGERIFVHGPSRCGKTTLLGLMSGILTGPRGSIELLGRDLQGMTPAQRDRFRGEHIGYLFQMFNLLPYLSVMENIILPLRLNRGRLGKISGSRESTPKNLAINLAKSLAETLGIDHLLDRNATELSVGQQQRVAAARALIGNPEILICDEPTSALDAVHRDRFLELLLGVSVTGKTTVIFVSHDQSLAHRFDRTVDLSTLNRRFRASTGDD